MTRTTHADYHDSFRRQGGYLPILRCSKRAIGTAILEFRISQLPAQKVFFDLSDQRYSFTASYENQTLFTLEAGFFHILGPKTVSRGMRVVWMDKQPLGIFGQESQ